MRHFPHLRTRAEVRRWWARSHWWAGRPVAGAVRHAGERWPLAGVLRLAWPANVVTGDQVNRCLENELATGSRLQRRCRSEAIQKRFCLVSLRYNSYVSVSGSFIPEDPQIQFDRKLRRAIFFGEVPYHACGDSLDQETLRAMQAVAGEFPNVRFESVLLAREELQRQLDGTHARNASALIDEIAKRYGWT